MSGYPQQQAPPGRGYAAPAQQQYHPPPQPGYARPPSQGYGTPPRPAMEQPNGNMNNQFSQMSITGPPQSQQLQRGPPPPSGYQQQPPVSKVQGQQQQQQQYAGPPLQPGVRPQVSGAPVPRPQQPGAVQPPSQQPYQQARPPPQQQQIGMQPQQYHQTRPQQQQPVRPPMPQQQQPVRPPQTQIQPPRPMPQAQQQQQWQPRGTPQPPQSQAQGPIPQQPLQQQPQWQQPMQPPRGGPMPPTQPQQQFQPRPIPPRAGAPMMTNVMGGPQPGQFAGQPASQNMGMPPPQPTINIDPAAQCPATWTSLTFDRFPMSTSLASQAHVPLGAVIQPLAEPEDDMEVPVLNYGSIGVVRCKRCRAYINPFVQWIENGRRWNCNICGCINDTNTQYYRHLDANGERVDRMERPELHSGIVEIVAPSEYMVRPPQPPVYLFVIDVSVESIQSGMLQCVVETIRRSLDRLPGAPRTQIGFITYDYAIHFYNLKSSLNAPQMLVVSDLEELFLPVPEDLLVNLGESRQVIERLLDSLPSMHAKSSTTDTALGSAIQAAFSVMSHIGGKMCVFQTKIPGLGEGKLVYRENPRALGTDKEHALFAPAIPHYKTKALEFSRQQISVEMFLFPAAYCDAATLQVLPKYTGGEFHYYPRFNAQRDGEAFSHDLLRSLTRETSWEAVMRVRASKGVRVTNFYGNFFLRGTDLLALPNCDADSAFGVEFSHEDKGITSSAITVQTALLYTNSCGERRIRVMTNCVKVTSSLVEVLEHSKQDEICNLLSKICASNVIKSGFEDARRMIQRKCVDIMRAHRTATSYGGGYNRMAQQGPGPGQPTQNQSKLPPNLRFLPLYTMALQKNPVFRGGNDVGPDERAALLHAVSRMPLSVSKVFIYPRMYDIGSMTNECGRLVGATENNAKDSTMATLRGQRLKLPNMMNLSAAGLRSDGAYVVDNGIALQLWLGRALRPEFLQSVFGVRSLEGIDSGVLRIQPMPTDDDFKQRLCNVLAAIRASRKCGPYLGLQIIKEGELMEHRFRWSLVEDRAPFNGGSFAYQEYLNHVTSLSQSGMPTPGR